MRWLTFSLIALVWLCTAPGSNGHTLPISFLTIVPDAEYLHLELTFNPFELSFAPELDVNRNGRIDPQEWELQQTNVTGRLLACLKLQVNGRTIQADVSGITPDLDSHHATLRAHYHVDARHQSVRIDSSLGRITSGSHLTQVTFGDSGARQWAQLDTQSTAATFRPLDAEPAAVATVLSPSQRRAWPVCAEFASILGALGVAAGLILRPASRAR